MQKLFWVSAIVQDSDDKKPWVLALSYSNTTIRSAKLEIQNIKMNHHNVLSAWIDTFDENNNKETVFHECYINAFGDNDFSCLTRYEILCIEKPLKECIIDAFTKNAIITSDGLSPSEFIHVCKGKAYYEDGACLGTRLETYEFLNSQEWARNHKWFVIRYLSDDKVDDIKKLRTNPRVYESDWYEKEISKILYEKREIKW